MHCAREDTSEYNVIPNMGYDGVIGRGLALNAHGGRVLGNIKINMLIQGGDIDGTGIGNTHMGKACYSFCGSSGYFRLRKPQLACQ